MSAFASPELPVRTPVPRERRDAFPSDCLTGSLNRTSAEPSTLSIDERNELVRLAGVDALLARLGLIEG